MSLLSNLLEFSNMQSSSLLFCESPKDLPISQCPSQTEKVIPKDLKYLMSARKTEEPTPEKRGTSKSLTKMNLFSLTAKVDPKQRILHRLAHKLEMKCRKYYYNFFVNLQTLKRMPIPVNMKPVKQLDEVRLSAGINKIEQLQPILFSKYYQHLLIKNSFISIHKIGRDKLVIGKIVNLLARVKVEQYFTRIVNYSKKLQKEEMRIQILSGSIRNICAALSKAERSNDLKKAFTKLKINIQFKKQQQKTDKVQSYKTPIKFTSAEFVQKEQNKHCDSIKTSEFNDIIKSYQTLNSNSKIINSTPGKIKKPIQLSRQQNKLKINKCFNYLTNYSVKTQVNEPTFVPIQFSQPNFQINRRCECDPLSKNQVPDLYDKNCLFFSQTFEQFDHSQVNSNPIAESTVHSYKGGNINFINSGMKSQDSHCHSHITLIAPLNDNFDYQNTSSPMITHVKANVFGTEAVSFKNSLVVERESMKESSYVQKIREKKDGSFLKIKNSIRNDKKITDDIDRFNNEIKNRVQSRYDSAEKDYNSLKFKRNDDLMISLPEAMLNYSNRPYPQTCRSQTPEADYLRLSIGNQRKHLSVMTTNNKPTQEDTKKPANHFIKITKKY